MTIDRTLQNFTMRPTSLGFRQFFDSPNPVEPVAQPKRPSPRMVYQTRRAMFPALLGQDEGVLASVRFGTFAWAQHLLRGAA